MVNYLNWLSKLARRAIQIQRNLGIRAAAGFLRNRGVSMNAALGILCY